MVKNTAPPRRPPLAAGPLLGLGLWAFAALAGFHPVTGFSSDLDVCRTEGAICFLDSDCGACLEALQSGNFSLDGIELTDDNCDKLYADVSLVCCCCTC